MVFYRVGRHFLLVAVSVLAAIGLIALSVSAATTISTNISTGGTLSVTGASTLTGAATLSSTLNVTGLATLGNASTTILSTTGNFMVNGFATTTASNGNIATAGTLSVTGASTLTGAVTTSGSLTVGTTASSTSLIVGSDQVSTINGLIFGYCTIPATTVAASSTAYANCTGATGVTSSYRVFVQATSSLPDNMLLVAASSTGTTGTINVKLFNLGIPTGGTASGVNSFNFWAAR